MFDKTFQKTILILGIIGASCTTVVAGIIVWGLVKLILSI